MEAAIHDPRRLAFPPAIPIAALVLAWALGKLWPIHVHWPPWSFWLGWALFIIPHGLGIWAHISFRRHQTTVNPRGSVSRVVTSGPFAHTRNPMYLSLLPLYIGGILIFRLPWALLLLPIVFVLLQFGVILPEEKYLQARFGDEYRSYMRHVNRWL